MRQRQQCSAYLNRPMAGLLVVAALVACGSDDDGDTDANETTEVVASSTGSAAAEISGTIVMASWGGSWQDATVANFADPFTDETGVEVQIESAPGEMVAKVQAQKDAGNITWDVIDGLPGEEAWFLFENGLLEPLPDDLRAELEAVSLPGSVTEFGIVEGGVSEVIACRKSTECPTNAVEFFDTEAFPGPRLMVNEGATAVVWALLADGVPKDQIYPLDEAKLEQAFAKLETIKPSVKIWATSGDQMETALRTGEVDYAIIWNGRVTSLAAAGVEMTQSFDGAPYRTGLTVIPKGAPNKEAAFEYLRYYGTHPEAQAEWSKSQNYGVASAEAFDFISDSEAARLPSSPENYEMSVLVDVRWLSQNLEDLKARMEDFIAG